MKCYYPTCKGEIPIWRERDGIITCSKKCSNAWSHLSKKKRESIKGVKYNMKNEIKKCALCSEAESVVRMKIKGKEVYFDQSLCEGCFTSAVSQIFGMEGKE